MVKQTSKQNPRANQPPRIVYYVLSTTENSIMYLIQLSQHHQERGSITIYTFRRKDWVTDILDNLPNGGGAI